MLEDRRNNGEELELDSVEETEQLNGATQDVHPLDPLGDRLWNPSTPQLLSSLLLLVSVRYSPSPNSVKCRMPEMCTNTFVSNRHHLAGCFLLLSLAADVLRASSSPCLDGRIAALCSSAASLAVTP